VIKNNKKRYLTRMFAVAIERSSNAVSLAFRRSRYATLKIAIVRADHISFYNVMAKAVDALCALLVRARCNSGGIEMWASDQDEKAKSEEEIHWE
ncbi:hypothetical protein PFISCL1PPCAC_4846, partial [Pristionchus fissidentatus]